MTDKVQKIREEVERLKRWNNNVRNSTRHMTLQEEDFNRGKHSSYLEILNFIDSLQEEPVSEELEEVIRKYEQRLEKENPETEAYDFASAIRFGANWQAAKDRETIETAIHHAYHNGRLEMKEQMMAKAVDARCFSYKNGFVHISCDIDEHLTDIKIGDKVKVIVIKED